MNAYELADKLEWHWDNDCRSPAISKSADMLRQQADRIAELESQNYRESHEGFSTIIDKTTPQTKPLSDEEIIKARQMVRAKSTNNWADTFAFARAIEERHGIKNV